MAEYDELWPGGPRFRDGGGMRLSTDSVLLASFCEKIRARRVLDLGCGAGVLTVLLAASRQGAEIGGVEILPAAAELCRANLRENGMDDGGVVTGDLREHRRLFPAGACDLVVSNPPYFAQRSGYTSPDEERAAARDERFCTLDDVCGAAKYLCRWGGAFALVHRPERLAEIFRAMAAAGIEPKRMRMVLYSVTSEPSLVLIEGRRGGRPGVSVEPPLILTDADGNDTPEVKKIYHRG